MEFEFVVVGTPRTAQTKSAKSRNDWEERVQRAALDRWPVGRAPLTNEISAQIMHFYSEATNIDVDGIGKLILDALKSAIIEDDNIVTQVLLRKTNQVGLTFTNPPSLLAETLGSAASFVFVRIKDAPIHEEMPQ